MFTVLGIDHIVLRVRDLEAALGFYRDVLGLAEERMRPDIGLYQLRAGAALVDIVTTAAPDGRNMDHFCLRLETFDEAAIRRHLARHAVAAGAVETRYGADGDGPSLYIADPEGNVVELKGPPYSTCA